MNGHRGGETGTVSVFALIILSALLLFGAVAAEFARAYAVRVALKQSLQAAVRSVHAEFVPALREYGLFAVKSGASSARILEETLILNLAAKPLRLEESALVHPVYLNDDSAFRRQVLEDMDYRAPIEYMLLFIEKIRSARVAEEVQTATRLTESYEKAQKALEYRDDFMDKAWDEWERWLGPGGTAEKYAMENDALHNRLPEMEDWEEIAETISRHKAKLLLQAIEVEQFADRFSTWLHEAEKWNEEAARRLEDEADLSVDDRLLYDPAFFQLLESLAGGWLGAWHAYDMQFDPVSLWTESDVAPRLERLKARNGAMKQAQTQAHQQGLFHYDAYRAVRRERERTEKGLAEEAQQQLSVAGQWMSQCRMDAVPDYDKLSNLEKKYRGQASGDGDMNGGGNGEEGGQGYPWQLDTKKAVQASFSVWDRLTSWAVAFKHRAYVIEYALGRFNYRAMTDEDKKSPAAFHPLAGQEAEYILFGFSSCSLNQAAAFAEIWMIRFAVRLTEALLSPKKGAAMIASPLAAFLWSALEAAGNALLDMKRLLAGQEVELSARLPDIVRLHYKDYLRMIMLLHGDEKAMLDRMQALVEYNTGIDLGTMAVASNGRATAELNPNWFLPYKIVLQAEAEFSY